MFGENMILSLVDHAKAFDPALREQAVADSLPLVILDLQAIVEGLRTATENFQWRGPNRPRPAKQKTA